MSWAFSGTSSFSAFSTARTEARACTVVHTPQMRWVMIQASRGSRPWRMVSMPRHMVPMDRASLMWPPSTTHSMRRWPSIRVIGSTTIWVAMIHTPWLWDAALAWPALKTGKYLTKSI